MRLVNNKFPEIYDFWSISRSIFPRNISLVFVSENVRSLAVMNLIITKTNWFDSGYKVPSDLLFIVHVKEMFIVNAIVKL